MCASKGFMETIRSGPDHGVAVKGELVFERVPSGAIGGALTTGTGVVPFAGAIDGRSFALALPTPVGTISGAGLAASPVISCRDIPRRGTLVGPRAGDVGDWVTAVSGAPIAGSYVTITQGLGHLRLRQLMSLAVSIRIRRHGGTVRRFR